MFSFLKRLLKPAVDPRTEKEILERMRCHYKKLNMTLDEMEKAELLPHQLETPRQRVAEEYDALNKRMKEAGFEIY